MGMKKHVIQCGSLRCLRKQEESPDLNFQVHVNKLYCWNCTPNVSLYLVDINYSSHLQSECTSKWPLLSLARIWFCHRKNMSTGKQKTIYILPSGVHLEDGSSVIMVLNLDYRASIPCLSCLTLAHKLDAVVLRHAHYKVDLQSAQGHVCSHYTAKWGHMPAWPPPDVPRVIRS